VEEEVDRGENCVRVGQNQCDNNQSRSLLTRGLRVWIEILGGENGDSPGIGDGLMKRGEELVII